MILALAASAYAVPNDLNHSGRLFDGTGVPVGGTQTVTARLFDVDSGGTAVWEDTYSVDFDEGYYNVELAGIPDAVFDTDLWIELDVAGSLVGRMPIESVPFAMRANTATNVIGGTVDVGVVNASEIQIGGNVVIDSSGGIAASGTLGSLSCGPDQIAVYDGADWGCGTGMQPLDEAAVDAFVANNGYLTAEADPTVNGLGSAILACAADDIAKYDGAAWVCAADEVGSASWAGLPDKPAVLADDVVDWSEVQNVPADLLDGDDDTVVTWATLSGIPADLLDGDDDTVVTWGTLSGIPGDLADGDADDWSEIANIPAGFADGVDDVGITVETDPSVNALAQSVLGCSAGELAKFDGSNWGCANDDAGVTVESDPTVNALGKATLSCATGQVAKFDGSDWICGDDDDTPAITDVLFTTFSGTTSQGTTYVPASELAFTLTENSIVSVDATMLVRNTNINDATYTVLALNGTCGSVCGGSSVDSGCGGYRNSSAIVNWADSTNLGHYVLGPGNHTVGVCFYSDGGNATVNNGAIRAIIVPQ